jgi:hypothetical protein
MTPVADEAAPTGGTYRVNSFLQPLAVPELDDPVARGLAGEPVTAETFLRFFCAQGLPADTTSLHDRYRRLSGSSQRLFVVPADPAILDTLIWPLRHARAAYMLGNYAAVVALCGMVAEALTLLQHRISRIPIGGAEIDALTQRRLFGEDFEDLNQARRIQVLRGLDLISQQMEEAFTVVRKTRNHYVHLDVEGRDPEADARLVYEKTIALVVAVFSMGTSEGRAVLRQDLIDYLTARGHAVPAAEWIEPEEPPTQPDPPA